MILFKDLYSASKKYELLYAISTEDVKRRYRRSILGPFWITLSMAILISTLGTLYGSLFKIELTTYIPFISAGLVIWGFISQSLSELSTTFVESSHYIKQVKLPLVVYIIRTIARNFIIFLHNLIIIALVLFIFDVAISWQHLMIIPAVLLLLVNLMWVGILISFVSARYRDMAQIITSLLQPIFFFTPIIWTVNLIPDKIYLVDYNPFFHLIEILRMPILGQIPSLLNWIVVISMAIFGSFLSTLCYQKYQHKVPYWVL